MIILLGILYRRGSVIPNACSIQVYKIAQFSQPINSRLKVRYILTYLCMYTYIIMTNQLQKHK